jgi:hypothetical protein
MSFKMKPPTFFNSPFTQKAEKTTVNAATCAKCGVIKGKHKSDTHAFTTNPNDPDWEGGDTFDVKPKTDPDAPGTKGKPGYEPPVKREDLDEEGKKIWDSHRKPK